MRGIRFDGLQGNLFIPKTPLRLGMSVLEELMREIEESPEKIRRLLEKMMEVYPDLSLSAQMMKVNDRILLLLEEHTRTWKAIEGLREDFNRETARLWEEIKGLREEQVRLREDFNRETARLWEEIKGLREEQVRIWQEIRDLSIQQGRLERRMEHLYEGLSASIMYAFGELSKFAGLTFEEFVRKFLTDRMRRSGEIPAEGELRAAVIDGEQVDIFLEEPLIVGEVTAHAESEEELAKLIRRARRAKEIYGREPRRILIVETARKDVARKLRKLAEEEGVEIIIGREF